MTIPNSCVSIYISFDLEYFYDSIYNGEDMIDYSKTYSLFNATVYNSFCISNGYYRLILRIYYKFYIDFNIIATSLLIFNSFYFN